MTHWIFKVSNQELYPDTPGAKYVFDNTHSTHVRTGDAFLYLDKHRGQYGFTGHGIVGKVTRRKAIGQEIRNSRVRSVYTAHLVDVVGYSRLLDIRPRSEVGKYNRALLGISDVNLLGWSASIAHLDREMYERIVSLAYEAETVVLQPPEPDSYEVPDNWSTVRKRHSLERFRMAVLKRQRYTCAICGTRVRELLEVAHISPYASDTRNRANPANGIGLCAFCHRAYDKGILRIAPGGDVQINRSMDRDRIAQLHVTALRRHARKTLLRGVDLELLRHSFELAGEEGTSQFALDDHR